MIITLNNFPLDSFYPGHHATCPAVSVSVCVMLCTDGVTAVASATKTRLGQHGPACESPVLVYSRETLTEVRCSVAQWTALHDHGSYSL